MKGELGHITFCGAICKWSKMSKYFDEYICTKSHQVLDVFGKCLDLEQEKPEIAKELELILDSISKCEFEIEKNQIKMRDLTEKLSSNFSEWLPSDTILEKDKI